MKQSEMCVDGTKSREVGHLERVSFGWSSWQLPWKQNVSHGRGSADVTEGNTQQESEKHICFVCFTIYSSLTVLDSSHG